MCRPRVGGDPSLEKHSANLEMDPRLRGDDIYKDAYLQDAALAELHN